MFPKKDRCRDAKHDNCQYHDHGSCDRLLSPAATAKAGRLLCLNIRIIKRQRTASEGPWMPEQHNRRLVGERTVNIMQVARRTVSPKNIAPATQLAKYADARKDITGCSRGRLALLDANHIRIARQPQECVGRLGPYFRRPPGSFYLLSIGGKYRGGIFQF